MLRHDLGCGYAVPSQQLCNISPTVDGLFIVKFGTLKATDNRDAFEFDTVVSTELDDDLMICVKMGGFFVSSDAPAAMVPIASSWVGAAWPAVVDARPCHILDCFQFFLPDALLAACWCAALMGN